MKDAKENWITEQCNNIDKGMRDGNIKVAFKTLKTLSKSQKAKSSVIEDKNGFLLTEETKVLRKWTEYCQELYNYELKPDTSFMKNTSNTNTEAGDSPILQEEVEKARTQDNEYVRQRIDTLTGKQEPLLSVVKCHKLTWFGHVNRHDSLAKTVLQGTVEGGCRRG
ncbi:hypothetical protein ACOMHN_013738 [Nucella lapillus]